MKILVVNAGSSSLKYQLIDMENAKVLGKGLCERIGNSGESQLKHKAGDKEVIIKHPMPDHKEAIKCVMDALTSKEHGVIADMSEIGAAGHRVVHGGERFSGSVLIDNEVMAALNECCELAPLHNPANLMGITACQEVMPGVPMVGVFDTAFHQTMPPKAYLYALPYEAYTKTKIRRYGFHGTSHLYVSKRAAKMLGKDYDKCKIITCHLGNGSSVAAICNGKSVDTSMGFTPLEGLPMGTRSGDVDPAILLYIMEKEDLNSAKMANYLNKESGMLGISGVSSDFRDLWSAHLNGNERATAALEVFAYRVKKYIGAYAAAMNGVDAIVFTAGIGENDPNVREWIIKDMDYLGVDFDADKNEGLRGVETEINKPGSKVKVFIIPTDEEMVIAEETKALV